MNQIYSTTHRMGKSIFFLLPMLLIMFVFMTGGNLNFNGWIYTTSFIMTYLFFAYLFFMILYSGKTDKYRAIGFVVMALLFCLTFMANMAKARGNVTFSSNEIYACEIPFCHIVTTMVLLPMVVKQTIIFPGSLVDGFASIASMLVIVAGVMIALGRGFCSWGCFYGGWDDGASRILKKPVIKKINRGFRWFSFVVLVIIALVSAFQLSPFYCDWLCPFKAVTEFEEITSTTVLFKAIVFWSLFIGLVIVLPILTKKRVQCATFCPMGALLSITDKINIFSVKINKKKCVDCKACMKVCPSLSLGESDIKKGVASFSCTKCGKCIDKCPKDAIHFHIKGTPIDKGITASRMLFLYPAFTFLMIFGSGNIMQGLMYIFKLISTGHLY